MRIFASVSVPVLSVHSTSMAPTLCMAASRLTMTRRCASRIAPPARVTVTIMGSSSGVSPTASASANISDSSQGRWNSTFTASTNNTRKIVRRRMRKPNWRIPSSKAVGGGGAISVPLSWPNAVASPVRQTTATALPLITEVPMKTALTASPASRAGVADASTRFSAG